MAFNTAIDLSFKLGATPLQVRFQPPLAEKEGNTLWVSPGSLVGLTLFLCRGYGRYRWHCYVIQALQQRERGVMLPFVTPGIGVVYYSAGNHQAAFFLSTLETLQADGLDPAQVQPDYYLALRHRLHGAKKHWRVAA